MQFQFGFGHLIEVLYKLINFNGMPVTVGNMIHQPPFDRMSVFLTLFCQRFWQNRNVTNLPESYKAKTKS